MDQMNKVAVKNDIGAVVGIMTLAEDNAERTGGSRSLVALQRSLDDDMRGNGWGPLVDHDAAERARLRAVAAAGGPGRKLFVSWATAEEVAAFERSRHRIN